jgi:GrpB-like predicted nucleotidyltransferase (UPF0157 family)
MTKDLNKLTTAELGQLFPIILTDYDPGWAELYCIEKKGIAETFNPDQIVSIEHIGSTAVPGLCAKPTIDILIEIPDYTDLDSIKRKLNRIGYQFIPKPENPPPHMMFAKGYTKTGISGQTFHIHIRYAGDWDELIFRDYLISDPETALEYAHLKRELADKYVNDREKYTENKTDFVRRIVHLARLKKAKPDLDKNEV